jgi:hypothetical protein
LALLALVFAMVLALGVGGGDVSMAQVGIGVRMMTARQINIDFVLE